ncbi:beta-1,6-N-acetylglucosaminyltransferase [Psychrobacter sp. 16-MNA-CIBAN-0192]|uniref:beta-1,6-N-acetylglucosaminyltransferase n=1 Tax=Psychrobacter sp. 16-MNA-CIBAN-0192 TaxID=3140448 RepID=UPI00331B2F36
MNVVYAITCHKITNPLIHTVNYLSSFDENTILIHVDKKSELEKFLVLKKSNVYLIPNRVEVAWGSKSQIESTLELMDFSLGFQYDFFFLLSGDDIPLKNNSELQHLLNKFSDYNFIDFDPKATYQDIEERIKYVYPDVFFQRDNKPLSKVKRRLFRLTRDIFYKSENFKENRDILPPLYKGSNWIGLKSDTIKYILDYKNNNHWFLELFQTSFCGDEVFFHTIVKNNPKLKIFNHIDYPVPSLRYIDWESGPEYPKVLGEEDKANMEDSCCLFARKIKSDENEDFMKFFLKD